MDRSDAADPPLPALVVLRRGEEISRWPLIPPAGPDVDLSVVDGLARLQLAARREGCSVVVEGACQRLRELLHLAGLTMVLPRPGSVQVRRQAECGEEPGVEEVVVPDDPVA
ncbi:MAG TPA: hypothetical protein VFO65_07655 [Acidimicrobiales bacterium]|nr:hypothetical protein [Acidimicrobiales bacterium]